MADEKKEEPKKKEKRPTAKKRDIQNEKRRLHNREFKSKVSTALRSLESAFSKGGTADIQPKLAAVYGLMDKGVKSGLFKLNRASRTKARLAQRAKAKA